MILVVMPVGQVGVLQVQWLVGWFQLRWQVMVEDRFEFQLVLQD